METIIVKYKKNIFRIRVKRLNFFQKGIGLAFKLKKDNVSNLLFSFNKDKNIALTSYFVFFPFLVLWLDKDNSVNEYRVVKPFQIKITSSKPFRSIIEIPLSKKNESITKFFVDRGNI